MPGPGTRRSPLADWGDATDGDDACRPGHRRHGLRRPRIGGRTVGHGHGDGQGHDHRPGHDDARQPAPSTTTIAPTHDAPADDTATDHATADHGRRAPGARGRPGRGRLHRPDARAGHASRSPGSALTGRCSRASAVDAGPRARATGRARRCRARSATSSSPATGSATTRPFRHLDQLVAGDEVIFDHRRRPLRVPRRVEHRDRPARRGVDHRPDRRAARPPCSPATRPARPASASSSTSRWPEAARPAASTGGSSPAPLLSLGAGFLVALSLPPWGWWPLAFVGVVLFELALGDRAGARRALRAGHGCSASAGWPSAWAGCGTSPCPATSSPRVIFAALPRRRRAASRRPGAGGVLGRPAAHTLAEALRFVVPVRRRAAGQPGHQPGRRPAAPDRPRRRA